MEEFDSNQCSILISKINLKPVSYQIPYFNVKTPHSIAQTRAVKQTPLGSTYGVGVHLQSGSGNSKIYSLGCQHNTRSSISVHRVTA